jgi:hypothetical protein
MFSTKKSGEARQAAGNSTEKARVFQAEYTPAKDDIQSLASLEFRDESEAYNACFALSRAGVGDIDINYLEGDTLYLSPWVVERALATKLIVISNPEVLAEPVDMRSGVVPASQTSGYVATVQSAAVQNKGYLSEEVINAIAKVTKKNSREVEGALEAMVGRGVVDGLTTRNITNTVKALKVGNPTAVAISVVGEINKGRGQGALAYR